jgi:hypothetical protein
MFTGWVEWLRSKFSRNREFVSLDAKRSSRDQRTFELLRVGSNDHVTLHNPQTTTITSPTETMTSSSYGTKTSDYFSKDISISRTASRDYTSPSMSFSSPRTPSQVIGDPRSSRIRDWDPTSTYARGGLGFHPPSVNEDEDDDSVRNRI